MPGIARALIFVALLGATPAFGQQPWSPGRAFEGQPRPAIDYSVFPRSGRVDDRQPVLLAQRERKANILSVERGDSSAARPSQPESAGGIPLPPPTKKASTKNGTTTAASPQRAMTTVFTGLAVVLGVFFLVAWISRRAMPKSSSVLPKEVVETLGRAPLAPREQMQLVRVANKLLLIAVSANGTKTLSEITDPVEVDRVVGLCEAQRAGSISRTFRDVLNQFHNEPAHGGIEARSIRETERG